jgi:D-proline reductase (dithiol) PrdB
VGLLAREVEAAGVTTVGLALVREVAVAAHAPRLLFVHWPFGHALGEPGRVEQHRTVLRDMLSMARRAPRPGLVVDLPYRWRRESYPPITDWTADGAAFAAALARALEAATPPVQ